MNFKVAKHKKLVRKTGGGPRPQAVSEASKEIIAMLPEQMDSLQNCFDCDGEELVEHEVGFRVTPGGANVNVLPYMETDGHDMNNNLSKTDEVADERGKLILKCILFNLTNKVINVFCF